MISLRLPFPVSTNAIWRSNRGRVHKSKAYDKWIGAANMAFLTQKRELGKPIVGAFSMSIVLDDKKRGKRDLDNCVKVVLDHVQRLGLIENDKLAEEISVRWGRLLTGGCLVQIFPATAEARAA